MTDDDRIRSFLDGAPFAVAGASRSRAKYGNRVLRAYLQAGLPVYAINPSAVTVEGLPAYARLADLPVSPHAVSIITPPEVTERIVEQAIACDVRHLWLQPGAESPRAIRRAEQAGLNVIHSGPCLLVRLGYRGD